MNQLDLQSLHLLNHLADASPALTHAIKWLYQDEFKTALMAALLWWAWFQKRGSDEDWRSREVIAASLPASMACVVLVRLLAAALPFRLRPVADPALGLHFPSVYEGWVSWSSFPSDNAVLFSMLATCLFAVSRRVGLLAAANTVLLICFPRVFLGIHYPTDVLAGFAIGVTAGVLVTWRPIRRALAWPALTLFRWHPPLFYASAFLASYLLTEIFWPLRRFALVLFKVSAT